MARQRRVFMVAERIREVLAQTLNRVSDPRLSLVTITNVVTSPDLRQAKVYWVPSGEDKRIEEVSKGFEAAKGLLRKQIADSVEMRFVPELSFFYDDTFEETQRVEDIFRKLELAKSGQDNEES